MHLNIGGYKWLWFDGYGRFSTGIARAMIQAGHDIYPFELAELKGKPAWYTQAQGLDFSHASIQLAPPSEFLDLPGRSIAFTMHESMTLPNGWADAVNHKNQLCLVPSPWLIPVFEEAGVKVPIRVVPGGIDPAETPLLKRSGNQPFTFGCLADRGNRKGHHEVHEAFYKAFEHDNRDVRLIMKCRPGSLPNLDFSYSSDPRLTVWRADVSAIADIFQQFDAFLFPTHCEGYGMPPREAAACGVPTLVTRFSGTADDCDEWAVPLEKYTLVESHMVGCGGLWAQPDVDELVWRMRDMVEHRDEYNARALKSAQWLRDNMTYAHAAQKLESVLTWWLGGKPERQALPTEPAKVHANGHHRKEAALEPR